MADAHSGDDLSFGDIEAYLAAAPVLQRVVEVNATVAARLGGRLVVTSAELWTTLIVVHYTIVGSDTSRRMPKGEEEADAFVARMQETRFLHDDLGNAYEMVGGGGGGGGDPALTIEMHQVTYRGPVAADANSLTFHPEQAVAGPIIISLA